MTMTMTKILVSDFDGVICNGLSEYFHSSELVYQQIWSSNDDLASLRSEFNQLRPVVETGWEMPLLLRALILNKDITSMLNHWHTIKQEMVSELQTQGITVAELTQLLDQVRQQQITENLDKWLSLHSFYDGVIDKLKQSIEQNITLYIITTKEGSFTRTLLEQQGVFLPEDTIFGKEVKRPKYETLKLIIDREQISPSQIYFIEDRLPALELVAQQPELEKVNLLFANWGYNTKSATEKAEKIARVKVLSLANFTGNDVF